LVKNHPIYENGQKVMAMKILLLLTLLCSVVSTSHAAPANLAKSHITITFTQMSVPVDASFKRFNGDINYDPNAANKASAIITVDISSFDLGDPEYNKEVLKPEWFNAGKYAQASFTSNSVRAISATQLEANGVLSIKGTTQNVVIPLAVKADGKGWSFSGELPIKRNDFNIGEGEWRATDMVADEVKIRFLITTTP
jgi:polyisoprenoid-binding protein YceI